MRELEAALGSPLPHLYDEVELGLWSEREDTEMLGSEVWGEERDRPWKSQATRFPWTSQLGPGDFGFITRDGQVTGLSLYDVGLQEIPSPVFLLLHLTRLLLLGNLVTQVPPAIGDLTALRALSIGEKQVNTLPDAIASLQLLTYLELHDSAIERLPPVLLKLPGLKHVVINTRVPQDDPVAGALRERALVEIRLGHYYTPEPGEVKALILDFARRHPRWDTRHIYHFLDLPSSIVEPALEELRREGLLDTSEGS